MPDLQPNGACLLQRAAEAYWLSNEKAALRRSVLLSAMPGAACFKVTGSALALYTMPSVL